MAPVRISYLVKQLERATRAQLDAIVGVHGITALQYTALSVLARHPAMSSAQLSRRSFVSAQAGNEIIGVLERKGLIGRTPDPANRRILRVRLTDDGLRVLAACDRDVDEMEARMLGPLTGDQVGELRAVLTVCVQTLTKQETRHSSAG
jgi:DNA-binding MarR family transcriptional regulator